MGLGWSCRNGRRNGPLSSHQTGQLRQASPCRWEHVPGSVMEIGEYRSSGFKMREFWGEKGLSCNVQSDLNCLGPSEM